MTTLATGVSVSMSVAGPSRVGGASASARRLTRLGRHAMPLSPRLRAGGGRRRLGKGQGQRQHQSSLPSSSSAVRAEEGRSSSASMASDVTDPAIPQDVLEMFKEAQQRIIDLNQSRLYALEELAEARAKIIDLEERLSQAEKDAFGVTMAVAQEAASLKQEAKREEVEKKVANGASGSPAGGEVAVEQAEQETEVFLSDYDDDDEGGGTPFEAATGVISILYETSWEPAFIHFNSPEQSGWTDSPGMKMKTGELPNHKIFSITASNLEFVLNDGEYEWDKPSFDANYFIGSPGSYILKNGKLEKVR